MMPTKRKYNYTLDGGKKVIGRIISIRGRCTFGLKVGDEFELTSQSSGGLCGYFYHNLYPYIMTYQFHGTFRNDCDDWGGNQMELACPDIINCARIQLRPEGISPDRHPAYLKDEEKEEQRWRRKIDRKDAKRNKSEKS